MKRSFDGGMTWGNLSVVYSNSSQHDWVVIGNAAALQERTTGKIIMPFCRNNLQVIDHWSTWLMKHELLSELLKYSDYYCSF